MNEWCHGGHIFDGRNRCGLHHSNGRGSHHRIEQNRTNRHRFLFVVFWQNHRWHRFILWLFHHRHLLIPLPCAFQKLTIFGIRLCPKIVVGLSGFLLELLVFLTEILGISHHGSQCQHHCQCPDSLPHCQSNFIISVSYCAIRLPQLPKAPR